MYETYFNLTDRPFASVPRTDHYFPAGIVEAARNVLTRCLDRGEGVALIVGPSGTGKSLLCQVLADHFQKKFQVALLACTHLDTRRSLLQAILYELDRPWRGMDESELRLSLVDYLALSDDCASGALLVVDDAHHLPLRLLDELRALTNLTRARQPAVRLLLAGNHLLEERFASPKLESFSQRISARSYLEAFERDQTQAYIWARIMLCGGRGEDLFTAEACRKVHKATGGVPRLVNQVCDHALVLAYATGDECVGPQLVEAAWAELQQLPTPWNVPASAPVGDSVIEFGKLDDDDAPPEPSPIAGKIPVSEEQRETNELFAAALEAAAAPLLLAEDEPPLDAETRHKLVRIHRLLDDVRTEFDMAPRRVALDEPVEELHPFFEPFEEEEVIEERYPPPAPPMPVAKPLAPVASAPLEPEQRVASERGEREADGVRLRLDAPVEATRSVVPPPHKELSRLFAKLRRGI